jgi:hypothetical protein
VSASPTLFRFQLHFVTALPRFSFSTCSPMTIMSPQPATTHEHYPTFSRSRPRSLSCSHHLRFLSTDVPDRDLSSYFSTSHLPSFSVPFSRPLRSRSPTLPKPTPSRQDTLHTRLFFQSEERRSSRSLSDVALTSSGVKNDEGPHTHTTRAQHVKPMRGARARTRLNK